MQSIGLIKASLNNYTVFITGGGSGIGYSTAILFAKMNANVAVNYLNNDEESVRRVHEVQTKECTSAIQNLTQQARLRVSGPSRPPPRKDTASCGSNGCHRMT